MHLLFEYLFSLKAIIVISSFPINIKEQMHKSRMLNWRCSYGNWKWAHTMVTLTYTTTLQNILKTHRIKLYLITNNPAFLSFRLSW